MTSTADNIVARLREEAQRPAIREICSEAVDIIERLCAAGDALVEECWSLRTADDAVKAWQEARRG